MRRLIGFVFLLCLFATIPSPGFAQKPKVLILAADDPNWAQEVRGKVDASGLFSTVDVFDMRSVLPSLSYLQGYAGVLAYDNYSPASGIGNLLADYVDGGGGLVISVFANASIPLTGRINTTDYQVLVPLAQTQGTRLTLGNVSLPNHPIMQGVSTFDGGSSTYRSTSTTLSTNSYLIASYNNGAPLVMAKENVGTKKVRRADLNFFPPSTGSRSDFWVATTDGAKLMANALLWVAGGGAPPARMSVAPESMNFGSQYPGSPTDLCGTIVSLGPGTLKINSLSITGSTEFSIVSGPAANDTLQMNQSKNFCIRFNPGSLGPKYAILSVQSTGLDSGIQTIELRGIGAAPSVDMSEAGLMRKTYVRLRDSAKVCVPIYSVGTGDVRVDSVAIIGRDADAYYISSAPTLIPQGEGRDLCIGFRPNFEGRTDAQVRVYTNAFNKKVWTVPMFGVGILGRFHMPSLLDFDSVNMGNKVCQTVTISNPGTDTVRVIDNYISSADADFTFTPIDIEHNMILPGDSVLFSVCFEPKKNGTRLARYLFYTNIPKPFDADLVDTSMFELDIMGIGVPFGRLAMNNEPFAPTAIGEQICMTDTLRNGGLAPVTIHSASIVGDHNADFAMSGLTFPLNLAPGEWRAVTLCMTATEQGARIADLVFSTTSEGMTGDATFGLTGIGLLNCAEASTPTAFDGMLTMVGRLDTAMVTITNCGEVTHIYTASITQTGSAYALLGLPTTPEILPTGTTTYRVVYAPTEVGMTSGTLTITGGPDPLNVTLMGTGGGVMLGASGSGGDVMRENCEMFDVTITNNGNVDWTPGTGTIGGMNGSDFTIEAGPTPSVIPPGGTGVVTIKFCPSTLGNETATLNFPDAMPAALNTTFPYTLTGQGVANSVSGISEMKGYQLGQVYPNPVASTTNVRINLPHSASVKLELISTTGESFEVASGRYPMGESTIEINSAGLPSGTYFYVLSNEEVRLSRQLTIVR